MKKLIANVAKQIPEAVISALLVISSFVVFFVFTGEKNAPWYGFLAGLAALILFDVCAVLTVFKAGNEMREAWAKPRAVAEEAPEAPVLQVLPDMPGARIDKKTKLRDIAIIVLGCAVVCVVCIFACACVVWAHNSTESFEQITRRLFSALDSQHYLYIAENGYTPATYDDLGEVVRTEDYGRVVEIVFLPGFPAAVALLGRITGDYFAAGMIVSYVCFALAGVLLYLTVLDEYGREDALFSVLILWLLPGSFFFVAPMTESMFLALTLGTIYCIKKKKWLPAGILGMYCAFTRAAGIIVAGIYLFELFKVFLEELSDAKIKKNRPVGAVALRNTIRALPVILVFCGLGLFLLINKIIDGDAFAFTYFEKKHWGQSLGWFFDTANYSAKNIIKYLTDGNGKQNLSFSVFSMNLLAIYGILGTVAVKGRKLKASYMMYALVYFAISFGVTWLLSGIRYMDGLFLVPLALSIGRGRALFGASQPQIQGGQAAGAGSRKKHTNIRSFALAASLAVISSVYLIFFCLRWQIW